MIAKMQLRITALTLVWYCVVFIENNVYAEILDPSGESNNGEYNKNFNRGRIDRNNYSIESVFEEEDDFPNLNNNNVKKCQIRGTCQILNYTTCFGLKLPYARTSLSLIPDASDQEEIQEKLSKWRKLLVHIPRCWSAIQPFLCALHMPKCDNGMVDLPSWEMCKIFQGPCHIVQDNNMWPPEFACNSSLFHFKCKNPFRDVKFPTPSVCKPPLVRTEKESWYYPGVEGCGVQCQDPLFTKDEMKEIRSLSYLFSAIAFFCNLFAVLTLFPLWSTEKYPSRAIFFLNLSFLVVASQHLYQQLISSGGNTVCRKDGTLRTSEPNADENLSCLFSFTLVYYPLIAALVWFVIIAYSWQLSSQAVGKIKEGSKDKRKTCYQLSALSLPLVLTVTVMALEEVDGDSVTGVCFVGVINKKMRVYFLLVPLIVSCVVGLFFFSKGLYLLIKLKRTSKDVISEHANAMINENIIKVVFFSFFTVLFSTLIVVANIYEIRHQSIWKQSLHNFVMCELGLTADSEEGECRKGPRPSVLMVQLQLLALFGLHIIASFWVCTKSTLDNWSRFFRKVVLRKKLEDPVMRKKHVIISRAFGKRHALNSEGHLSIDMNKSRQDPVGLNFELNSLASNNLSTTWLQALPKLLCRRGGLILSNSSQRQSDSAISYSVRRVSVESRRHSIDSTISVQAVELTVRADSAQILSQDLRFVRYHAASNNTTVPQPNMERRQATVGFENESLQLLLAQAGNSDTDEDSADAGEQRESKC